MVILKAALRKRGHPVSHSVLCFLLDRHHFFKMDTRLLLLARSGPRSCLSLLCFSVAGLRSFADVCILRKGHCASLWSFRDFSRQGSAALQRGLAGVCSGALSFQLGAAILTVSPSPSLWGRPLYACKGGFLYVCKWLWLWMLLLWRCQYETISANSEFSDHEVPPSEVWNLSHSSQRRERHARSILSLVST